MSRIPIVWRAGALAVMAAVVAAALSACALPPDADSAGHNYTNAWGGYHR